MRAGAHHGVAVERTEQHDLDVVATDLVGPSSAVSHGDVEVVGAVAASASRPISQCRRTRASSCGSISRMSTTGRA